MFIIRKRFEICHRSVRKSDKITLKQSNVLDEIELIIRIEDYIDRVGSDYSRFDSLHFVRRSKN